MNVPSGAWAGRQILVLGCDGRAEWLVRLIRARGGHARLQQTTDRDPPDRGEWCVLLPGRVDGAGRVGGPDTAAVLAPAAANQSAGVLAAAAAPEWLRAVRVPVLLYGDHPWFAWSNAVPTAEGAVAWALTATPRTVAGSRIGVLGFGRVGRTVAHRLSLLGARVTVACREDERPAAHAAGHRALSLNPRACRRQDMIINTIPAPLVDESWLVSWPSDCPALDLASRPGGFTPAAARRLGNRLEHRDAIPAALAPATAAEILADTLRIMLEDHLRAVVPEKG